MSDKPPPQSPKGPTTVRIAAALWIWIGSTSLVLLPAVLAVALIAETPLVNVLPPRVVALALIAVPTVVSTLFVYVGVRTLKGAATDTLGNGLGSLGLGLVLLGLDLLVLRGLIGSGLSGQLGLLTRIALDPPVVILVVAGFLALVGRRPYRTWRGSEHIASQKPREAPSGVDWARFVAAALTNKRDREALAFLGVAGVLGFAGYSLLYSRSLAAEVTRGVFGEATPFVVYLRVHILAYLLSYLLIIAALVSLILMILPHRRGTASSVPWTETAIFTATALSALGLVAGGSFARPVWGFVPSSDPKLLLGTLGTAFLILVVAPTAVWVRVELTPNRRHKVLLILLCASLVMSMGSLLLGRMTRSIHPSAYSQWLK